MHQFVTILALSFIHQVAWKIYANTSFACKKEKMKRYLVTIFRVTKAHNNPKLLTPFFLTFFLVLPILLVFLPFASFGDDFFLGTRSF